MALRAVTDFNDLNDILLRETGYGLAPINDFTYDDQQYPTLFNKIFMSSSYVGCMLAYVKATDSGTEEEFILLITVNDDSYLDKKKEDGTSPFLNDASLFEIYTESEYDETYVKFRYKDNDHYYYAVSVYKYELTTSNNVKCWGKQTNSYWVSYGDYETVYYSYDENPIAECKFFSTVIDDTREIQHITTLADVEALILAKTGYAISSDVQYDISNRLDCGMVFFFNFKEEDTTSQALYIASPYQSAEYVNEDDIFLSDSDLYFARGCAPDNVYLLQYNVVEDGGSYIIGGARSHDYVYGVPDYTGTSVSTGDGDDNIKFSTIKRVTNPTIDEAIERLRTTLGGIKTSIFGTFTIKPDVTKLLNWLNLTPGNYYSTLYRGYKWREDATELIVVKAIECFNTVNPPGITPVENPYANSRDIWYQEEGNYSTRKGYLYFTWDYQETRYTTRQKGVFIKYEVTLNSSGATYPYYLDITNAQTENVPYPTEASQASWSSYQSSLNGAYGLIIPITTLKPKEFAKYVKYQGNPPSTATDSNQYNWDALFGDISDAIRYVDGTSENISVEDMSDRIEALARIDLISAENKNMTNWTTSGSGSVTLAFTNNVNEMEFRGSFSDISQLSQAIEDATGIAISTSYITSGSLWQAFGSNTIYGAYYGYSNYMYVFAIDANSGGMRLVHNGNIVKVSPINSGTYNFRYYNYNRDSTHVNGTVGGMATTAPWELSNIGGVDDTKFVVIFPYTDKTYSLTVPTTANSSYSLSLKAKSPTGFDASTNHISITNGSSTENITLSNTASNDFSSYSATFTAEGSDITITLDLSTITGSGTIELDIKDVSMYASS